ncbi:TRAF family member-associated NF-kappa-B activator isoform X2 [Sorex araneus]|uniref:TRAF family member-associated NF-kappa-B activator isoform X2 n=1 Tax=Sorex araneus TaxID=42254 RepID=UPI002433494D|nr:TRAF family member-associated NF-kappa-B activator isoform X2 [Sorex araneus]
MDKNIGQQLNKAYEAYRQACMDRDSAIKELQQKTENYEQKIREQQEQLSYQQTIIDKLKSQLLLMNSSQDNSDVCVPLLENIETRKNKLTFDQPNEKMKSGMPRDKESKGLYREDFLGSERRISQNMQTSKSTKRSLKQT